MIILRWPERPFEERFGAG